MAWMRGAIPATVLVPFFLLYAAGAAAVPDAPGNPDAPDGIALATAAEEPLVSVADFTRELMNLPPPAREALTAEMKAELLETLVGRRLVEREAAAAGDGTDPVKLARLAAVEIDETVRAFYMAVHRAHGAADAELERRHRALLAADPPRTREAELFFATLHDVPDAASFARPLFEFSADEPFTLLHARAVFELAREREGIDAAAALSARDLWLDRLLKTASMLRLARREGIAGDPALGAAIAAGKGRLRAAWYLAAALPPAAPDEAAARAWYEAHPELFTSGGETRVQLIRATTETAIREIRLALLDGAPFEALARAHSVDPSAAQGGEWGILRPYDDPPAPLRVALDLPPGAFSEALPAEDGTWVIVRALERTPRRVLPYSEVRERVGGIVAKRKAAEARRALFDRLKKKHGAVTRPERIP